MHRYSTRDAVSLATAWSRCRPAALECDPEPTADPVDVLLVIDREHAPRAAELREEAIEAVERADVKHATAAKPIRAEHRKAVAVVPSDPRRVDPRRKRERVKPERNRIADALRLRWQADAPRAGTRYALHVPCLGVGCAQRGWSRAGPRWIVASQAGLRSHGDDRRCLLELCSARSAPVTGVEMVSRPSSQRIPVTRRGIAT